ncbi:hypothetical protein PRIPAC_92995 [Pristionchus pacificus]|nr:hypothetical protein PRIPAC_92995 [Pristionchus pacificus]
MGEIRHLWLLPVVTTIWCLIGIVVPYAVGAADGNIQPILPFISDGGAYPPEKNIFSLFQNISAVLIALSAYVKHLQFVTYYECRRLDTFWKPLSILTMVFGFLAATGLCVVGNFSEMDELAMHNYAALVTFFSSILYLCFTAGLSFLRPLLCSPPVAFLRVALAIVAAVSLAFHECTLQFSIFVPAGTNETENSSGPGYVPEWLTPDSPFYVNHLVATGTEWLLAFSIFTYFITFVEEFRKASLSLPAINFNVDRTSSSFRRQQTEESWKL